MNTIELITLGVGLAVLAIISIGRDKFGRYTLKRSPNSLFLPLFFERLLKTKWKVIEFGCIVVLMGGVYSPGGNVPFGVVLLLALVLVPVTVSLLGRILKANIWKDDKPPSMVGP